MPQWFYPPQIREGFNCPELTQAQADESMAHAWEYNRCVCPTFTDWDRYIAFAKFTTIAVVAEFKGELTHPLTVDRPCGYDLDEILETIFGNTVGHEEMSRQARCCFLITSTKASQGKESGLLRRYADALVYSPKDWFRLRDTDGLIRFYMAASLACNDFNTGWPTEEEWQLLAEIGAIMYDSVAFFKHRAEGEIMSTFAYVDEDIRTEMYAIAREVLWMLDSEWAKYAQRRVLVNMLRSFGGPIHMMMRRYRFVEDAMVIGKPPTEETVKATRENYKLWYRVAAPSGPVDDPQYDAALAQQEQLMFDGMAEMLERPEHLKCTECTRPTQADRGEGMFNAIKMCDHHRDEFSSHMLSIRQRVHSGFDLA
ncbi:hypothetical protein CTZ27_25225 [Streptomyces griseocarneus]|nr:hypothetical protein CTZ27_25225 [Streptomyces griseocarneus]